MDNRVKKLKTSLKKRNIERLKKVISSQEKRLLEEKKRDEDLEAVLDPSYYYLAPLNIKELKELLCAYLPVVKFG